jgi:small neutral amino acid transporter SnatA (MarC family)
MEEQGLASRGAPAFERPDRRPGIERDADEQADAHRGRRRTPVPLALSSIAGPSRISIVISALFQKGREAVA